MTQKSLGGLARVLGRRALWLSVVALLGARPAAAVPLAEYPEIGEFIEQAAGAHGFDRAKLRKLFERAQWRPEIIAAMDRPAEGLPWHEYRGRFVTAEHLQEGGRFWRKHAAALGRAERTYGVPPETIVAIIGIETQYGRNAGSFPVLDALTTLGFGYPRRAEFFQRELVEYLLLARDLNVDAYALKGSYAGALGIPQFMPSSYRAYAVDFSGDSKSDLWKSSDDAIGSVAHFLARHGWLRGEPVVDAADIAGPLHGWLEELGLKPALRVSQLVSYGVFPRAPETPLQETEPDRPAALVVLEGENGPIYRLGYNNFYVITRYNRSKRYAMAVYELGRALRQQYQDGT